MKAQVKIARACGYEYGDFLLLGKGDWSPGISKQPHQSLPRTDLLLLDRLLGQYEERLNRIADS